MYIFICNIFVSVYVYMPYGSTSQGSFSLAIAQWKEVLGILVGTGGPALFLESMKGIAAGRPRPYKAKQA